VLAILAREVDTMRFATLRYARTGRIARITLDRRMARVPRNQLMMQKLMINQAYDNMGLASTQMLATLFDGITRHSREGLWFKRYAETHGFHQAVRWRDSGRPIPAGRRRGGSPR
jgi:hypothetical protein